MHIGFLALDYPTTHSGGGVGNQIRLLAQALVAAGHRVTVVALGKNAARTHDEGVTVCHVAPGNLHWYLSRVTGMENLVVPAVRELEYAKAIWSVVRKIHAEQPFDLLEGTETGSVWTALRLPGVPLVIRLHGDPYTFSKYTPDLKTTPGLRLSRMVQRVALRCARLLISPSASHRLEIDTELGGRHPFIQVIPNMLANMERSPTQSTAVPMVLFVGRLEKCKGIATLLETAGIVHRSVPACRFVLAGAPHPTISAAELEHMIDRHDLRSSLDVMGHIAHEELLALYGCATVAAAPSYYETFGVAVLEAMSFGVPVVATTAGSFPEVVQDGVAGLLTPPGDAQALAAALTKLLLDKNLHRKMSENGRQRSRQFVVERQMKKNLATYEWATSCALSKSIPEQHAEQHPRGPKPLGFQQD